MSRYELLHGDCLEKLKGLPDNSVDAIVCDPPYDLTNGSGGGFMGKKWDATGIAFRPDVWIECLRVLKPGGHLLAFGGTRTYHRMTCAIEDAGFDIRQSISWIYGSGFPKSANISKMIDKMKGAEREVIGTKDVGPDIRGNRYEQASERMIANITAPATPEAAQWEGWGSDLKPAHEPIVVARKKLTGTIAANVLEWGTGGINIDACRVAGAPRTTHADGSRTTGNGMWTASSGGGGLKAVECVVPAGRFPPNVLFSHLPECRQVGTKRVKGTSIPRDQPMIATRRSGVHAEAGGHQSIGREQPVKGHADPDGLETVEAWECADGCAVRELDEQSGTLKSGAVAPHHMRNNTKQPSRGGYEGGFGDHPLIGYGDSGGASRFFPTFRHGAEEYECADGCPVKELDAQSGDIPSQKTRKNRGVVSPNSGMFGVARQHKNGPEYLNQQGGASRFFPAFRYQAKAPPKERKVEGVEGQPMLVLRDDITDEDRAFVLKRLRELGLDPEST